MIGTLPDNALAETLRKSRKKTNPVTGGMKQSVGLRVVGANRKWQFFFDITTFQLAFGITDIVE
jgi:hypothetical protein